MKKLLIIASAIGLMMGNAYSINFENNLLDDVSISSVAFSARLKPTEKIDADFSKKINTLKAKAAEAKKAELAFMVTSGEKYKMCIIPITHTVDVDELNKAAITIQYGEQENIKCVVSIPSPLGTIEKIF